METFLRVIHHIAEKDYQKRIWILGEGPEVDDFDETASIFFTKVMGLLKNMKTSD